jgi:hypothetical protein
MTSYSRAFVCRHCAKASSPERSWTPSLAVAGCSALITFYFTGSVLLSVVSATVLASVIGELWLWLFGSLRPIAPAAARPER